SAEARASVICNIRCRPTLQRRSLKVLRRLVAAKERFRRMAGGAMRTTIHQERAAIPFGRFGRSGDVFSCLKVEAVPYPHRRAYVERERQRVANDRVVSRRPRVEIS